MRRPFAFGSAALAAAAAILAILAACSTSYTAAPEPSEASDDARSPSPDAPAADAADGSILDAAKDGGTCDPHAAFGPPALVAGLSTVTVDYAAQLTPDELTVYFASTRGGAKAQLFVASRSQVSDPFSAVRPVQEVASTSMDDFPSLSPGGGELFFSRASDSISFDSYDIFVARRMLPDAAFAPPTRVEGISSSTYGELEPFVAQNGDLYFASDRRAATGFDIVRAARLADGGFDTPMPLEEIASAATEGAPVLSFDLETLYFASARTEQGGKSNGTIWVAYRAGPTGNFGSAARVAELTDPKGGDFPTWLSRDNCRLYMMSFRSGRAQIYVATRSP